MKYYLKVYGCQMNKSDGERIAGLLEQAGWKECYSEEEADLIIVIACSVRQTAVDRVYGRAVKYQELKKESKNLKTFLTGCVLDIDKKKLEGKFDVICGIGEIRHFLHTSLNSEDCLQSKKSDICAAELGYAQSARPKAILINTFLPPKNPPLSPHSAVAQGRLFAKGGKSNCSYLSITPKYSSSFQAYIPIMTGCDNFCSYCVVPYTRSREYSRPAEDILGEVCHLVEKGYKEITLIGQNVNSYRSVSPLSQREAGGDFPEGSICSINKAFFPSPIHKKIPLNPPIRLSLRAGSLQKGETINFPSLLRLINSIQGDFWIRFATSHPKDMSDDLIGAIAECEKVCHYLHLPIQAGSDKILDAMNRKYTKAHYLSLIKKIKEKVPDVMLSTDIIVGFPNETEKDFLETADVFRKVKYTMAYIARYSPREGTASYKFKDNVPRAEKARREEILTEILKETALENNKKFIGRTARVLVERQSPLRDTSTAQLSYIGKTAQFTNVRINANQHETENENTRKKKMAIVGQFADVKILNADCWGMEGEFIKFT